MDEPVSHSHVSEEEQMDEPVSHSPALEDEPMSHSPVPDDGEEEGDGLIAVPEGRSVFLRGASRLPERGKPVEQRPCITPYGVR